MSPDQWLPPTCNIQRHGIPFHHLVGAQKQKQSRLQYIFPIIVILQPGRLIYRSQRRLLFKDIIIFPGYHSCSWIALIYCIFYPYSLWLIHCGKQRPWSNSAWWHHGMKTPSILQTLYEGDPTVTTGFPSNRANDAGTNIIFDAYF